MIQYLCAQYPECAHLTTRYLHDSDQDASEDEDLPELVPLEDSDDEGDSQDMDDGDDFNLSDFDSETMHLDLEIDRNRVVAKLLDDDSDAEGADKSEVYEVPRPCDENGVYLADGEAPAPATSSTDDDWAPYKDRLQFEVADFLYTQDQMGGAKIDKLLELWAASVLPHGDTPPFRNHDDLYRTIDLTPLGDVSWRSFEMTHPVADDPASSSTAPSWMTESYEVWYRDVREVVKNMLANPDFKGQIDYAPVQEFDADGVRQLRNLMGGDWAWAQADIIAQDPNTHGAAFVPIILGSDKTTVSVATGQNEYYPLYASIGNIHNTTRRAHRNGVAIVGFLAIPKTKRKYNNSVEFRKFRRQLFHSSLSRILRSLTPGMTAPEIVIYGLGPYIADYPEQALLASIVQGWCAVCLADKANLDEPGVERRSREDTETLVRENDLGDLWDGYGLVGDVIPFTNDFPRADIHELMAPDILHQLVKGTFKDHLVTWVEALLVTTHGKAKALDILSDIDRRIAVVPPFSGLRRFPQGRGFKQWTGDDSKALMKVYIPAISGYCARKVVTAVRSFLDFCYLVRREVHTPETLSMLNNALKQFHRDREVFRVPGVRPEGFSLPRQHSCVHYEDRIWSFGAPNGLCSSITESKHIQAVKEPWRRSNRFEALGQMLLTNQRMDKVAASRVHFRDRGMLEGTLLSSTQRELSGRKYPRTADALGDIIGLSTFGEYIRRFLFHQLHPDSPESGETLPLDSCPPLDSESIYVHNFAEAVFYAPSDPSGVGGMRREFIRATPDWRKGGARYDCVFVNQDSSRKGLLGMDVAQVKLLFTLCYRQRRYQCALVHWYQREKDTPDGPRTRYRIPVCSVIDLATIFRAAHLIPVYNTNDRVPDTANHTMSLSDYDKFYVNKYVDHHAFDLLHC
ncbi:hypothetical protein LXA43DRAFT_975709 [Ganoderma leucocontextum]|nr:hypothetical protein LXA43DRAFT_975709 [Ganoderma leucocontextum]